jgi:hypothetical protein
MVGQIPGKMFDHPIEKDCVQIYPIRQVAGSVRSGNLPDRKVLQLKI